MQWFLKLYKVQPEFLLLAPSEMSHFISITVYPIVFCFILNSHKKVVRWFEYSSLSFFLRSISQLSILPCKHIIHNIMETVYGDEMLRNQWLELLFICILTFCQWKHLNLDKCLSYVDQYWNLRIWKIAQYRCLYKLSTEVRRYRFTCAVHPLLHKQHKAYLVGSTYAIKIVTW